MAPVEEGVITWLSGCSSSLQISIVSALFIIINVILYSLCTSCYRSPVSESKSSMNLKSLERKNIPSEIPQNDVRAVTEQFHRNENLRLKDGVFHGHITQRPVLTPSQIPGISIRPSSPTILPLPSLPSSPTAHLEPSFHLQDRGGITTQSNEFIPPKDLTDHIYSQLGPELNEENPYDYISECATRTSVEGESENPQPTMIKPVESTGIHSYTALKNPVNNQVGEQTLSQSDEELNGSEPTAVYAAVNWKTKSQKHTESLYNTDADDTAEEILPPIPDKHF